MNALNFAKYVRKETKTNTTTFPDDVLLMYMNIVQDDLVKEIAKTNEDVFGMIYYRDLVFGQREYSLPDYILNNIKFVEVDKLLWQKDNTVDVTIQSLNEGTCLPDGKLDPSGKYVHCDEIDLNTVRTPTDEDAIQRLMWGKKPAFDIYRNSLWIYSGYKIPPIKDGIKLHAMRYPNPQTDLTNQTIDLSNDMVRPKSAGIPRQFHLVWATQVIIMYKNSKEKPIPLNQREQNVDQDLQLAMNSIKQMNLDRIQMGTIPLNTGENY
jgi:hypothetical protein